MPTGIDGWGLWSGSSAENGSPADWACSGGDGERRRRGRRPRVLWALVSGVRLGSAVEVLMMVKLDHAWVVSAV
ncbi:hypothetical protein M0R45_018293 [Rubus argutus]|uniref:Uncharacterized protein n=1 Tax=Rubus argutus TaxID=59490 RepID=A0AAW1X3Q8_RUBAR